MCSVSGVLILKHENYKEIEAKLIEILKKAEDRGRDSFGVAVIQSDGKTKVVKSVGRPSLNEEKLKGILDENSRVVIANNRGSSRVDLQACKLGTGRRFTTS
jgi:Glucosamine 6-phosphate synthetase, contains amidotransferase and phosphosugar isomerase domains